MLRLWREGCGLWEAARWSVTVPHPRAETPEAHHIHQLEALGYTVTLTPAA